METVRWPYGRGAHVRVKTTIEIFPPGGTVCGHRRAFAYHQRITQSVRDVRHANPGVPRPGIGLIGEIGLNDNSQAINVGVAAGDAEVTCQACLPTWIVAVASDVMGIGWALK